jgi:hypothetical protein
MDATSFDAFARSVAGAATRRTLLGLLGQAVASAALTSLNRPRDAAAQMSCERDEDCRANRLCCPSGSGKMCVDVQFFTSDCGGCGVVCAEGDQCCFGHCANVTTDPQYCGRCLTMCTGGDQCVAGVCQAAPAAEGADGTEGTAAVGAPPAVALGPAGPDSVSGISGPHYLSPTWHHKVSWDPNVWGVGAGLEVVAAPQTDWGGTDLDLLRLELRMEGEQPLFVMGYRGADGDPQRCLEEFIAWFGAAPEHVEVLPAEDRVGQPIGGMTTQGAAYGAYTFSWTTREDPQVLYLECRTLVPHEAVQLSVLQVDKTDYNASIDAAIAVIDTLEIYEPPLIDPRAESAAPAGPAGPSGASGQTGATP